MDNNIINVVRNKSDIVDIISERLPLVQKGKNFFGVCPFHDDTNPSMSVSKEKQIYTCFSCGATGNVFNFIMDYEHLSFREALSYLADKQGVSLGNMTIKSNNSANDKFYDIYNLSLKFYQNNLLSSKGHTAKDYLLRRGLNDDIIKKFSIGLSFNDHSLVKLLTSKQYDLVDLNNIGLASNNHDLFLNRIMFPLHDISGKVVGFSGRIYDNSDNNKYLNTKETVIFKKGLTLYNYHLAKDVVRVKKSVIVMEGFMDVIRASTIGVDNVVALMGTALTSEQANLLKRLSPNIILCLDGDSAGRKATLSIGETLSKLGVEVKVIALEDNLDPDEYIVKNGENRFLAKIEQALFFTDYKMNALKTGVNFHNDEEKAKYLNSVLVEASKIDDEIRLEIILKNLAKEFEISYNTLEKRVISERQSKPVEEIKIVEKRVVKPLNKYEKAMRTILYHMIINPSSIAVYERQNIYLPEELCRICASEIIYFYQRYGEISLADFMTSLEDKMELRTLFEQIISLNITDDLTSDELVEYFDVIRDYNKNLEIKRLTKLMEKEVDPIEQAKISQRIVGLRIGAE